MRRFFLFAFCVLLESWGTSVKTTTASPYASLSTRKHFQRRKSAGNDRGPRGSSSSSSSSSSSGETIARVLAVPLAELEDRDVYMQPVFRRAFELLEVDLGWQCHTNSSTEMFDLFDGNTRDGILAGKELGYLSEYFESGSVPMELFDKDQDGTISKSEYVAVDRFPTKCKNFFVSPEILAANVSISGDRSTDGLTLLNSKGRDVVGGQVVLRGYMGWDSLFPAGTQSVPIPTFLWVIYRHTKNPAARSLMLVLFSLGLKNFDRRLLNDALIPPRNVPRDYLLIQSILGATTDIGYFKLPLGKFGGPWIFDGNNSSSGSAQADIAIGHSILQLLVATEELDRPLALELTELPHFLRTPDYFVGSPAGDAFSDYFGDIDDPRIRTTTLRGAYKFWATVQRMRRMERWKQTESQNRRATRGSPSHSSSPYSPITQPRYAPVAPRDPTPDDEFLVKYLNLRWVSPHFRALEARWDDLEARGAAWGPEEDKVFRRAHALEIAEDFAVALAKALVKLSGFSFHDVAVVEPRMGWNVLHTLAVLGQGRVVQVLLDAIRESADLAVAQAGQSVLTTFPAYQAVQFALRSPDRHLRRTPLHIAARLHGKESRIFQTLVSLETAVFGAQATLHSERDRFNFTAREYSVCTNASHGCSLPRSDASPFIDTSPDATTPSNILDHKQLEERLRRVQTLDEQGGWKLVAARRTDLLRCVCHFGVCTPGVCEHNHAHHTHFDVPLTIGTLNGSQVTEVLEPDGNMRTAPVGVRTDVKEHFGLLSPTDFWRQVDAGRPFVMRGAAWELFPEQERYFRYSHDRFLADHGDKVTAVGKLPYEDKFSAEPPLRLTVRDFVQQFNRTDMEPLSLFSTEFTQQYPDLEPDTKPIAEYLAAVREASNGLLGASTDTLPSFHLGGPGAGAPLHWHEFALNVQMFGMKRWILFEGGRGLRSRASALEFFEEILPTLQRIPQSTINGSVSSLPNQLVDAGAQLEDLGTPLELLTRSGDITVVPKGAAHATINIEPGLALAYELKYEYYNGGLKFE